MKWSRRKKRHHHHHHHAASAVVLSMTNVFINLEEKFMQVNLTWTTPSTRIDGTPLALSDIQATRVLRNGTDLAKVVAVTGAMAFTDSTPLTGSDVYEVVTDTTDGLVSADSNAVTITVAAANPASAITDLAGTLVP
jgi:hypothetical protein